MRTIFSGRDAELRSLQEAFEAACAKENSHPQVVVLVGDRGIGKTRIMQEFYSWLSTNYDGRGPEGYWPDDLGQQVDNLRLNVEPSACNFEQPMPFLWWGMRLCDPASYNSPASSAFDVSLRF